MKRATHLEGIIAGINFAILSASKMVNPVRGLE
jgi:hypothetical protein